jgi:uncharacterized sulfatase
MEFGRFEIDHDGHRLSAHPFGFNGRYKLVINLLDNDEFYDLDADG